MAEEEVDWEAQWSNMVENGQIEDRFGNATSEAEVTVPTVELPSLEDIDQSMANLATQITEGWQQLADDVQRHMTEDWVKIVCDDMKESLLSEEKEEEAAEAEFGWAQMLIPSQQRLPFKDIRRHFGITIHEMVESVQVGNVVGTYSEGKSGEVLVISKDLKFVLKTLSFTEYRLLFSFLPAYLEYIKENPKTLLVRFYATFSSRGQYYIIMNNIFATGGGLPREKYDLKGATSQRYTPDEEKTKGRTLKDGDFVNSGRKIYVPRDTFGVLNDQIKKDTEFLATQHVMDYSLLVGIIYETGNSEDNLDDEEDFIARIAAQPLPPNHGITNRIQEILPSWLTPATAARTEHNATQTTTTQQTEQTSTPTNGGVEKQTPMPTAGSKSSTPSVPRNIVPPTGSTGKNFPNSFSAFNPDTKRVEHVCLGIIDMFMYYHEGRALFSLWRRMSENAEEISTVEPKVYGERFTRWMGQYVFVEGTEETSVEKK